MLIDGDSVSDGDEDGADSCTYYSDTDDTGQEQESGTDIDLSLSTLRSTHLEEIDTWQNRVEDLLSLIVDGLGRLNERVRRLERGSNNVCIENKNYNGALDSALFFSRLTEGERMVIAQSILEQHQREQEQRQEKEKGTHPTDTDIDTAHYTDPSKVRDEETKKEKKASKYRMEMEHYRAWKKDFLAKEKEKEKDAQR